MSLCKGPLYKYSVIRPMCPVCEQRPCAINYKKLEVTHYRSRCETCLRKNRNLPRRRPNWQAAGYRKKMVCDRCGFRARYSAQILVYHVDGTMTNCDVKNLKSVCRNCHIDIMRSDLPWRRGDLEPDV